MTVPRAEHPRPQLLRSRWVTLNGRWHFAFDDADRGLAAGWWRTDRDLLVSGGLFDRRITVPFAFQTDRSGIGDRGRHDVVWYARVFDDVRAGPHERLLLHVGAADYRSTVWVNSHRVVDHEGGYTPFSADLTDVLSPTDNVVVVRVEDPLDDLTIPRGKQYWRERPESIFYTATTGIWQSVWLEPVHPARVDRLDVTPDLHRAALDVTVELTSAAVGATARIQVRLGDIVLVDDRARITGPRLVRRYSMVPPSQAIGADVGDWQGVAVWTPESPVLHDVRVEVHGLKGELLDGVDSYVGMRDIAVRDGQVLLNGHPLYQRLVLDQGYFPDSGLTAATDEDLRRDVELVKELGFNGVRMHQKAEDPRWLHWADRLGLLVWSEMPSAYQFTPQAVRRVVAEWQAIVERDRNHPCIVAWVPMNESWGVPELADQADQRDHLLALHHLTKALDPTRVVVSNDGWEHARTDLLTIHDYRGPEDLAMDYRRVDEVLGSTPAGRPRYTSGHAHRGEPILLTEFGGVAIEADASTWGYHTVPDADGLLARYEALMAAVAAAPALQGFCYTQLTDVEQEANGLLTFDRKPKADPALLRAATTNGLVDARRDAHTEILQGRNP